MSKKPTTSQRPLSRNRLRSNRRPPPRTSQATTRLEAESSPWAETVGRDWDPDRERERDRDESGTSTGNATASANSARSSPKNHAGDQEGRRNRLILISLPAAPSEHRFPQPPPSVPENEPEERSRHRPAPGVPEAHGLEEEHEETFGEGLAADPFVGREPRRGRGRGRPSPPPPPPPSVAAASRLRGRGS